MNFFKSIKVENLFPFLRWFLLNRENLRQYLLAGIAVALILMPQSMLHAHLADLPFTRGLYAPLPPMVLVTWHVVRPPNHFVYPGSEP